MMYANVFTNSQFFSPLTRYGTGQHDSLRSVRRVHQRECERSPSEEAPSPEREKIYQSDSPGSIICRYRQETFWPSLAWKEWWDKLWHPIFDNSSTLTAFQYVVINTLGKQKWFCRIVGIDHFTLFGNFPLTPALLVPLKNASSEIPLQHGRMRKKSCGYKKWIPHYAVVV